MSKDGWESGIIGSAGVVMGFSLWQMPWWGVKVIALVFGIWSAYLVLLSACIEGEGE